MQGSLLIHTSSILVTSGHRATTQGGLMKANSLAASVGLLVVLTAAVVRAGGPGADERKLELGKCLPSGARCIFDCDSFQAVCANPTEKCTLDATYVFTGLLTWEVNDSPCSLSLLLEGRKTDGSTFTASQSNITSYCDQSLPCNGSIPRPDPFFCDTNDGELSESNLPGAFWLGLHKFTSSMASQIKANFPSGSGEPIVVKAEDCQAVEDNSANSSPTKARFCIKGYLVRSLTPQSSPPCF